MRFIELSTEQEEKEFLQIMEKLIWSLDEPKYKNGNTLYFLKEQCDNLLKNCSKKDENILEKFKHQLIEKIIRGSPHGSEEEILERLKESENIWNDSEIYKSLWRKRFIEMKINISSFF